MPKRSQTASAASRMALFSASSQRASSWWMSAGFPERSNISVRVPREDWTVMAAFCAGVRVSSDSRMVAGPLPDSD
ncbi:MAG: hypothetical protein AAB339_05880 [Elusimicrobiota bacterium]